MNFKNEIEKLYGKSIFDHSPRLNEWIGWYKGYVEDFHNYEVPKGAGEKKRVRRLSMGMAKSIGENYANLLINEKTDVVLENESDNELLNKVLNNLLFWSKENEGVEKEFALGSISSVVQIETSINARTGELVVEEDSNIHYEILDATKIYPLSWKFGEVEECAFVSFGSDIGNIVLHVKDEKGNYDIKNYVYKKKDQYSEWELNKEESTVFKTNSKVKLFSYSKPNVANNIDFDNPVGISIYANAIDTMKSIDAVYDGYYYEFILGKKRVFASSQLTMIDANGQQVRTFDENDLGVYVLPVDDDGKSKLNFEEGSLRADAYSKALNDYLSMLSYQVGFGKDFFSFGGEGGRPIQTATAIIAQNSELFRNINKQEIYVEKHLKEAIRGIIFACNKYTNYKFSKDYSLDEIQIRFDDSIFEDKESQRESDRKDVSLGVLDLKDYRMKWFAESEEQATEKVNSNPNYIGQKANALIPLLSAKAITSKEFVRLVYGSEDSELTAQVEKALNSSEGMDFDSINGMFGNA